MYAFTGRVDHGNVALEIRAAGHQHRAAELAGPTAAVADTPDSDDAAPPCDAEPPPAHHPVARADPRDADAANAADAHDTRAIRHAGVSEDTIASGVVIIAFSARIVSAVYAVADFRIGDALHAVSALRTRGSTDAEHADTVNAASPDSD